MKAYRADSTVLAKKEELFTMLALVWMGAACAFVLPIFATYGLYGNGVETHLVSTICVAITSVCSIIAISCGWVANKFKRLTMDALVEDEQIRRLMGDESL